MFQLNPPQQAAPSSVGAPAPAPMTGSVGTSLPMQSPVYFGCAGCASTYGATISEGAYNPRAPGFQGPMWGNGPFDTLRSGYGAKCGFNCTSGAPGSCGANYVHPQDARTPHDGRAGCGQPACTSNAEAVATIYTRGSTYGCSANPIADRLAEHKYANATSNWRFSGPRDRFLDIVQEFGPQNWLVNQPGGEATWLNRAFYSRITLRDESVGHGNHCDYLYATIGNMLLPPAGIPLISQLSPSLLYDPLRQELTARGNSMQEIVPQLIVAIDVALDSELSVAEAQAALPKMMLDAQNPDRYVEMARSLEEQAAESAQANVQRPNLNCK